MEQILLAGLLEEVHLQTLLVLVMDFFGRIGVQVMGLWGVFPEVAIRKLMI